MNKELNLPSIENAMQKLGLNKAKLAEALNVSRTIVSMWFNNDKFPKPDKILKLATILELPFSGIVLDPVSQLEPVVAFRKKQNRKTKDSHINRAKDMGRLLESLVPYITSDRLTQPPVLKAPVNEYRYIQAVASQVRNDLGVKKDSAITIIQLLKKINEIGAVILPVQWGSCDNHENALHIYLPSSKTTWIYLNLDSNEIDFNFWVAHELGHVLSPSLRGDIAEDFADQFAQSVLFPEACASKAFELLSKQRTVTAKLSEIKKLAKKFIISPITIVEAVNCYANAYGLKMINLEPAIYPVRTNFNKRFGTFGESIKLPKTPLASEYIKITEIYFNTSFFKTLKLYLQEKKKSPGFVQTLLEITLIDAKEIYTELVK